MGVEAVSLRVLTKSPPQPLPTRGRGSAAALPALDLAVCADASTVSASGATGKPSPLWGGLGGVFLQDPGSRRKVQ
ncbi:hypothetical protein F2982_02955 [Rhizobium sp. BG4]|nr:hypothetical protein F2982_02955 [Rhizobium sp. BG4]